jgi:hypothetical protein
VCVVTERERERERASERERERARERESERESESEREVGLCAVRSVRGKAVYGITCFADQDKSLARCVLRL